jgi:multidrug resistance efflux pump
MTGLAPIPIPLNQRLHEVRVRFVPLVMFAVTALVAAMLWRDTVSPAMLVGEVASERASVNSPTAATLQYLRVKRLDRVKAGDVMAELMPSDPRQSLDALQNELSLLRIKADAANEIESLKSTQDRMALDYERLRVDWMSEKVALVLADAKARKATMDLEISRGLVTDPAQSQRYLQEAELALASAEAEKKERKDLVDSLGGRLAELQLMAQSSTAAKDDPLARTLALLETRLRDLEQSLSLITLRAPMDGIVTSILHHAGENVKAIDPLIVITATQPENIVGYLRQPLLVEPVVGQAVEVRSHDRERRAGEAVITRVGAHFEPIINPALHPATTAEVGVPVEISLPSNLRLRPGELVNLVIKPLAPQNL